MSVHYEKKRFRPNDLKDFDPRPQKPSSDNKRHRLDNFIRNLQIDSATTSLKTSSASNTVTMNFLKKEEMC